MLHRLVQDGVLTTDSAAVTLGGDNDTGDGMLPEQKMEILERLEQAGLVIFQEPKFLNNLEQRQEIYERQGPIQCFVSVGGNVTSMGVGERWDRFGAGSSGPKKRHAGDRSKRSGGTIPGKGNPGRSPAEYQAVDRRIRPAI